MTTDEAARHVGATGYTNRHYKGETAYAFGPAMLAEFVKLIQEQERERCAKLLLDGHFLHDDAPAARLAKEAAKAIRGLK